MLYREFETLNPFIKMKELSLHIFDIVENSIRAKAKLIEISITEDKTKDQMIIEICDNGSGMTEEQVSKAIDPFYTSRTTRKVGLGLSLFKQAAEATGGSFSIESKIGIGTKVKATFGLSHIDRPIMGNIKSIILLLICSPAESEYVFKHKTQNGVFELDTREIKLMLDNVPITNKEIRNFISEMIDENLEQIQISE